MGYYIYHYKIVSENESDLNISPMEIHPEDERAFFEKFIQKTPIKSLVDSNLILDDRNLMQKEKIRIPNNLIFHKSDKDQIDECIT